MFWKNLGLRKSEVKKLPVYEYETFVDIMNLEAKNQETIKNGKH